MYVFKVQMFHIPKENAIESMSFLYQSLSFCHVLHEQNCCPFKPFTPFFTLKFLWWRYNYAQNGGFGTTSKLWYNSNGMPFVNMTRRCKNRLTIIKFGLALKVIKNIKESQLLFIANCIKWINKNRSCIFYLKDTTW